MKVMIYMEKLHVNDLQTACGINVDPYKLHLKPAYHTPVDGKSLAMLKTMALYTWVSSPHGPLHVSQRNPMGPRSCQYLAASKPHVLPPHPGPVSGQVRCRGKLCRQGGELSSPLSLLGSPEARR